MTEMAFGLETQAILEAVGKLLGKLTGENGKNWLNGLEAFLFLRDPLDFTKSAFSSVTLAQAIDSNELSVRARRALTRLGCLESELLCALASRLSLEDLLIIKNCGVTTVREIEHIFASYGFGFKRGVKGALPYCYRSVVYGSHITVMD